MTHRFAILILTSTCLALSACSDGDIDSDEVSFDIRNDAGQVIGSLELESLGANGTDIEVELSGLDGAGTHAMHFHETGLCEAPAFTSSGGHFNPEGVSHGEVGDGPHAGDMMNIQIGADGSGEFEVINTRVSIRGEGGLPALMDSDGAALVIHAKADDYTSQPSGAAGPRIACAVIPPTG